MSDLEEKYTTSHGFLHYNATRLLGTQNKFKSPT